jgi:hypothetical protein
MRPIQLGSEARGWQLFEIQHVYPLNLDSSSRRSDDPMIRRIVTVEALARKFLAGTVSHPILQYVCWLSPQLSTTFRAVRRWTTKGSPEVPCDYIQRYATFGVAFSVSVEVNVLKVLVVVFSRKAALTLQQKVPQWRNHPCSMGAGWDSECVGSKAKPQEPRRSGRQHNTDEVVCSCLASDIVQGSKGTIHSVNAGNLLAQAFTGRPARSDVCNGPLHGRGDRLILKRPRTPRH